MDIEYSPGAPRQRIFAAARDLDGFASGESVMNGKRLCSMGHPATVHGERARRFFNKRTIGVLWRHSSVNLVGPRFIALAGPKIPRRLPEIDKAVSIPDSPPQPARLEFRRASTPKMWGFSGFASM